MDKQQHQDKNQQQQSDRQQHMDRDKKPQGAQVPGGERKNNEEVGEPVQLDEKSKGEHNQPHKPDMGKGGEQGGQQGGQRQGSGANR